jgi:cysteine synthase A
MKIAKNITELVGNTPLVKLNTPSTLSGATLLGKCEFMNPTSSVKDRIGMFMIQEAIKRGEITQDTTIIEPTSGNTGVALAAQSAALGLKLILTMPDSMSIERRKLLSAFGATLVLTPASQGMNGAIAKAQELAKGCENSFILQQFENSDNPLIHYQTTAKEIIEDTDAKVDIFVAAVGTGGTLSGTAKALKEFNSEIEIYAVEPLNSAVLSGGKPSAHKIQGIGAGFIPKNVDTKIYDGIIKVSDEDALATAKMLARKEGLLVGISSGANVYAAMQIAKQPQNKGKTVVTILCDTGERYLSTELFSD